MKVNKRQFLMLKEYYFKKHEIALEKGDEKKAEKYWKLFNNLEDDKK